MVSLREFLENSSLQSQLQDKLFTLTKSDLVLSPEAKTAITAIMQAALENYVAQVVISGESFDNAEDIQEAIEEITYNLSPGAKSEILASCNDDSAYRLGRLFHNMSKKQLPC